MNIEELYRLLEGLSSNGPGPTSGHGEGFETQNDGQVRRFPGEAPSVNGGRTQSQEMDSFDQPQYEGVFSDPESDPFGMEQTCDRCGATGNWDSALCQDCGTGEEKAAIEFDDTRTEPDFGDPAFPMQHHPDCLGDSRCTCQDVDDPDYDQGMAPFKPLRRENIEEGWKQWAGGAMAGASLFGAAPTFADELPQNYQSQTDFRGDLNSKQGKEVQSKADIERDKFMRDMNGGGSASEFQTVKAEMEDLTAKKRAGTITPEENKRAMELYPRYKQLKATMGEMKEEFMGVRDSDVLDKQDPFCGSNETSGPIGENFADGINEKDGELEKKSEKESGEHPWLSKKDAKHIAKDHIKMGENKITLKEFFNVNEAGFDADDMNDMARDDRKIHDINPRGGGSMGKSDGRLIGRNDVETMKKLGWNYSNGRYYKDDMQIEKEDQSRGSTADDETPGYGESYLLGAPNAAGYLQFVAAHDNIAGLAKDAEMLVRKMRAKGPQKRG